nr:uncharacterized protein LOC124807579 isoform X2 [Hydra vulgaris]
MAEVVDEEIRKAAIEGFSASVVKMSLLEGSDRRRCYLPSHDEVAVVFVSEDGAPQLPGTLLFTQDLFFYLDIINNIKTNNFMDEMRRMASGESIAASFVSNSGEVMLIFFLIIANV